MPHIYKRFFIYGIVVATATFAVVGSFEGAILLAADDESRPTVVQITDDEAEAAAATAGEMPEVGVRVSRNLQPPAPLRPPVSQQPDIPLPQAGRELSQRLATSQSNEQRITSGSIQTRTMSTVINGAESVGRVTGDAGSLLGNSPASTGISIQRRTPIMNDPRIHGSRVGSLAASGSYWVPARIDLDTAISKFDSRCLDSITAIPGPFTSLEGPGYDFLILNHKKSPRYEDGFEMHGASSVDFHSNGQRWHGRQEVNGGNKDWGFSLGYSHRTGNDYFAGDGEKMPASFNSREFDLALGTRLSPDSSIEFNYLHLDQTGVEFPGQAFDIRYLKTDGFDLEYELLNQDFADRVVVEGWYNHTQLDGNANSSSKHQQFPIYDAINFIGRTDVNSSSAGYSFKMEWAEEDVYRLTIGTDLRDVRQELNEVTSARVGTNVWTNANSPIPRSESFNPGIFVEQKTQLSDPWQVTVGGRGDWVHAAPVRDPAILGDVGTSQVPYSNIMGTTDYDQQFGLWGAYVNSSLALSDNLTVDIGLGHGQRAPNLTELYVAESFMFLIQNGLNTVTGDPLLNPERRWEVNFGADAKNDNWRITGRGYFAWIQDYITFESLSRFPPVGNTIDQINLKYVNTDLATLAGTDVNGEFNLTPQLTPFATLQYVQGTDRTRNGLFATLQESGNLPSERVANLPRGFFSQILGGSKEALPGISPLQSRMGVRWHSAEINVPWSLEFSARVVGPQDRVATSLGETRTGGFTVFDLRGYWKPRDHWTLTSGFENMFDRNYREHLDFRSARGFRMLQPGLSFYAGTVLEY